MGQLINSDNFNTSLILREFNHSIDFEYEFRAFIFQSNLTSITQYNNFIYLKKQKFNFVLYKNHILQYHQDSIQI